MGVSGAGKSTIGSLLASDLGIPFFDGDDYHPKENIEKMASGKALNDNDRLGWLQTLNGLASREVTKSGAVIACSALKKNYRTVLSNHLESAVKWIYLSGDLEQIRDRINKREGHFMSSDLLQSQFDILEEPKDAIKINIDLEPLKMIENIRKKMNVKSELGLFGLGVMGKSLSRNLARNGVALSLYNRTVKGLEENVAVDFQNQFEELSNAKPFDDISSFVDSLQVPRKVILMVNAGRTIDYVIEDLLPFLEAGDVLIDGGNSNYSKTKERSDYLKSKNIQYIGMGVSGGQEGALKGPSIMPGGNKESYEQIRPFLEVIAAKDADGLPCCTYIGQEGSGHFVKMVHNGIEYAEMQLLADVYVILKAMGNSPDEIADILTGWQANANSYLLEITIDILRKREGDDWLVNQIMDKAGNKGTGNWTTIASAQLGVPSTLIASALFARYTSYYKEERVVANSKYESQVKEALNISKTDIFKAYQFARLINHYQGFKLIYEASNQYSWGLNLSELARIWTNGCIIRSDLMVDLIKVFKETNNMLTHPEIVEKILRLKPSIKKVVAECILSDLPTPSMIESISFLNSYTVADSSANLIQAQRDYFGAHTYQRKDDESDRFYHTEWNSNE